MKISSKKESVKMNKTVVALIVSDIVIFIAFGFLMYQKDIDIERLKSISETYAKENESLKIDIEMLRKKLAETENRHSASGKNDFAQQQNQKFKAMRDEIERLKSENRPDNREKEEQIWDYTLDNIKTLVDIELTKRLLSFGFKPEETEECVNEYKMTLEKSKDIFLQWYRNEITDADYEEKIITVSRNFYDELSKSVGKNLASITLSVVFPDYEFRKKMFEEK